jgi:type I restriction enzyme S subunit
MSADWQTVRIGDLGKVVTGKTPSTAVSENFGGNYPFITIPDLDGRREITASARTLSELGAQAMRSCRLPAGAVMMSCIATIGKCGITTRASFTNQQINSLICKDGVDPKFVYYSFSQLGKALEAAGGGGSVYTNVSKSRFESIEIKIPSLQTQKAIVAILVKLDDKIESNRRINQTLEAMAQALFKSWFVDFDPVRAKIAATAEGRDPMRAAMSAISGKPDAELDTLPPEALKQLAATASLFPDEMEESELGEIPRGWACGTFGELATLVKGSVNPLLSPDIAFEHYSLPAFDAGKQPVIEKGSEIKSNKTRFTEGVVLHSKLNPHIPRVWFPFSVGSNAVCSTEFLPWMATAPATPEFVYCLLTSPSFEILIRGLVTGTSNSHQRVKPDQVANLPVVVPCGDLFDIFSAASATSFSFIGKGIEQISSVAALRDTLLPKLLSGELSVTEAMAEAEA